MAGHNTKCDNTQDTPDKCKDFCLNYSVSKCLSADVGMRGDKKGICCISTSTKFTHPSDFGNIESRNDYYNRQSKSGSYLRYFNKKCLTNCDAVSGSITGGTDFHNACTNLCLKTQDCGGYTATGVGSQMTCKLMPKLSSITIGDNADDTVNIDIYEVHKSDC